MNAREYIEQRLALLKAESERLQTALQVIDEAENMAALDVVDEPAHAPADNGTPPRAGRSDLRNMTAMQAAQAVLTRYAGAPMHYKQVFERAMRMGFRPESSVDAALKTMRRKMSQRTDLFEKFGDGLYALVGSEKPEQTDDET
jgi:hypothetical protein